MNTNVVDFKNLSKEEAIKMHREMWSEMAQYEEDAKREKEHFSREEFKWKWLSARMIPDFTIRNNCFLCEYAYQQWEKEESVDYYSYRISNYCKHCPVNWSCDKDQWMCESGEYDWRFTSPKVIAELPERGVSNE